ncbi:MAG: molybdenum cofactor biosynthesis protein MoaE [Chloroflexota bacterium]|nr:molybdenum cofactor biosynthesis protein MoaE [Chloroflexota bacterium]
MSVQVTVRLFAMQRVAAGWRQRTLELAAPATVGDAWQRLLKDYPVLAAGREHVRFARNAVYADAAEQLQDGDEVAIIPPVAGGASDSAALMRFELSEAALGDDLLAELRRTVPTAADGALVLFVGQTRESAGTPAPGQEAEAARLADRRVRSLEYESFDAMVLEVLSAIGSEIATRFGVRRLAIIHRTGTVPVGVSSVVIAAASAHRGAAFDACRYAIEELKARAPIWKSERFDDGSVWQGAPARTTADPPGEVR